MTQPKKARTKAASTPPPQPAVPVEALKVIAETFSPGAHHRDYFMVVLRGDMHVVTRLSSEMLPATAASGALRNLSKSIVGALVVAYDNGLAEPPSQPVRLDKRYSLHADERALERLTVGHFNPVALPDSDKVVQVALLTLEDTDG